MSRRQLRLGSARSEVEVLLVLIWGTSLKVPPIPYNNIFGLSGDRILEPLAPYFPFQIAILHF